MNTIGIVVALTTFLSIWAGHVGVRKIEYWSPTIWLPSGAFALLGIGFEYIASRSPSSSLSAAFGILGITLLWDSLEFHRQQKRVKKGHAPINPNNPRHIRILANYPSARIDPFKLNSSEDRIIQDLGTRTTNETL